MTTYKLNKLDNGNILIEKVIDNDNRDIKETIINIKNMSDIKKYDT